MGRYRYCFGKALALVSCIAILFSGCAKEDTPPLMGANLTITGDVEKEIIINSYKGYDAVKIQEGEQERDVIPLLPLLEEAGLTGQDNVIFLSSPDGALAGIPCREIDEECWLRLSSEFGWEFISLNHPRQVGIKFMDYIVIAAQEPGNKAPCLRFIEEGEEKTLTYGQLFAMDSISRLVFEGQAMKGDYSAGVYRRRNLVPVGRFFTKAIEDRYQKGLAYFADGSQEEISWQGFLEWRGSSADYIGPDSKSRKKDIIGIWAGAPVLAVTDLAPKALSSLVNNRVLIILLDGLSYYDLKIIKPAFLGEKTTMAARTVMPSITPVALASIVTGEYPDKTGVKSRDDRELHLEDMFVAAEYMGKTAAMIGGSTQVINVGIGQILNPDLNGNDSTDDEVFIAAVEELKAGRDLTFVHFHGYDDVAHTYGPLSPQALQKMIELDGYIEQLCMSFAGKVYIIADHGQHATSGDKLGDHGEFRALDMTVPWVEFEIE